MSFFHAVFVFAIALCCTPSEARGVKHWFKAKLGMKVSKVRFDVSKHTIVLFPIDKDLNCELIVPMPSGYLGPLNNDQLEKLSRINSCIDPNSDYSRIDVDSTPIESKIALADSLNESFGMSAEPIYPNEDLFRFRDLEAASNDYSVGIKGRLTFSCFNNPVDKDSLQEYREHVDIEGRTHEEVADIADRLRELESWQQEERKFALYTTKKKKASWWNMFGVHNLEKFAASHANQVCRQALHKTIQIHQIVFPWKNEKSNRAFIYAMLFHPERLVLGEGEWTSRQMFLHNIRERTLSSNRDLSAAEFFKKYMTALSDSEKVLEGSGKGEFVEYDTEADDSDESLTVDDLEFDEDDSDSERSTFSRDITPHALKYVDDWDVYVDTVDGFQGF